MKRVLITGGTGFLGRYLAVKLKKNYEVMLAARNNSINLTRDNLILYTDCGNVSSTGRVNRSKRRFCNRAEYLNAFLVSIN